MAGGSSYPDSKGSAPQHYGPQEHRHVEPVGEIVTVFSEANPNYRLTHRQEGAVLAFKNSRDVSQQWILIHVGPGRGAFVDREGQPGFILVNKASGFPLKHGRLVNEFVTIHNNVFSANSPLDGSFIWSLGRKDEGSGFKGIRTVTNISLNLEAESADKAHGGVRDGNRLRLSSWLDQQNFRWKIQPFESLM